MQLITDRVWILKSMFCDAMIGHGIISQQNDVHFLPRTATYVCISGSGKRLYVVYLYCSVVAVVIIIEGCNFPPSDNISKDTVTTELQLQPTATVYTSESSSNSIMATTVAAAVESTPSSVMAAVATPMLTPVTRGGNSKSGV